MREFGKDKVEGAEEDDLCVICQAKPVDPVEVSIAWDHIQSLSDGF